SPRRRVGQLRPSVAFSTTMQRMERLYCEHREASLQNPQFDPPWRHEQSSEPSDPADPREKIPGSCKPVRLTPRSALTMLDKQELGSGRSGLCPTYPSTPRKPVPATVLRLISFSTPRACPMANF